MSFLFGTQGVPQPNNKRLGLNDTSTASNEQGNPLPVLYGSRRFAGTFISDAFNQNATQQGGGGKNSGKGGAGQGYNYYTDFVVAWCLGPVDAFSDLFLNGDAVYTESTPLVPESLVCVNNVATATFTNAHGLSTGQEVVVTGADQSEFDGEFEITVSGPNTFTYVIPGETLLSETASPSATGQIQIWIKLSAIVRGEEDFVTVTIPNYGTMTLYWGTETQPADPDFQNAGAAQSPLHGVCYSVFHGWWIGLNQTNIQNAEIVLTRNPSPDWIGAGQNAIVDEASPGNITEANPAAIVYDLLTNPRSSIGLSDADFNIPGLQAAATLFFNEGFGLSNIIIRAEDALTLLQEICETVDAALVLDGNGLLNLIPIRQPASYVGLPQVGDAQLAEIPTPKAYDWSNTFNDTKIVFPNNQAGWLNDFVEWFDFSAITAAQKVAQPQTLQRPWMTRRDLALLLVQYAGTLGALPQQTGSLKLFFSTALWNALSPGSLFQLAYSLLPDAGGYFRVTKRTLPNSAQPVFEIEYAADRSYLYTV